MIILFLGNSFFLINLFGLRAAPQGIYDFSKVCIMQTSFIPSLHILYVWYLSIHSPVNYVENFVPFFSQQFHQLQALHTVLHLPSFNFNHFPFQLMLLCYLGYFFCCCPCFCLLAFGLISFLFSLFARLLRSVLFLRLKGRQHIQ